MIFISYAKEDTDYACKIYVELKKQNLAPWMDKPPHPYSQAGLQIGQKWQSILIKKINLADFIILILSPTSVKKRGYVQTEFRMALDRMNYLPDEDVLVLPILIEDCEVPALTVGNINLQDLQWDIIQIGEVENFAINLAQRIKGSP